MGGRQGETVGVSNSSGTSTLKREEKKRSTARVEGTIKAGLVVF